MESWFAQIPQDVVFCYLQHANRLWQLQVISVHTTSKFDLNSLPYLRRMMEDSI